ncbi:MAG: hypothetical protein V4662_15460 [Verrucomicrobiota bacterium]
MSRPSNPFVLHTLLGIACLVAVMFLLPEGTELWRKVFAGIFSVTLGFQLGRALQGNDSGPARIKLWLEALAFPMLILAFLRLPEWSGWLMLAMAVIWRLVVAGLFKKS